MRNQEVRKMFQDISKCDYFKRIIFLNIRANTIKQMLLWQFSCPGIQKNKFEAPTKFKGKNVAKYDAKV